MTGPESKNLGWQTTGCCFLTCDTRVFVLVQRRKQRPAQMPDELLTRSAICLPPVWSSCNRSQNYPKAPLNLPFLFKHPPYVFLTLSAGRAVSRTVKAMLPNLDKIILKNALDDRHEPKNDNYNSSFPGFLCPVSSYSKCSVISCLLQRLKDPSHCLL